jgi:hypothetical protein
MTSVENREADISETVECGPFATVRSAETFPSVDWQRADLWFGPIGWERVKQAARRRGTTPLRFLLEVIDQAVGRKGEA